MARCDAVRMTSDGRCYVRDLTVPGGLRLIFPANASGGLSAGSMPVTALELPDAAVGKRTSFLGTLPWVLGGFGLLLTAFGGWWYVRSIKGAPGAKKYRHTARRAEDDSPYAVPAEGAVYCHQCGKRAGSGDVFCRTCGSKLRHE